jgi:hypothetical protein
VALYRTDFADLKSPLASPGCDGRQLRRPHPKSLAIWILLQCLDRPLVLLALQGQVVRQLREDQGAQRAPAHLYHLSDRADRLVLQSSQRVPSR